MEIIHTEINKKIDNDMRAMENHIKKEMDCMMDILIKEIREKKD